MQSLSVELKLAVAILVTCAAMGVAGAHVAGRIFERNLETATRATLRGAADAFAAQERSDVEKLAATLDALLANDRLREAFRARDRERLLEVAAPLFATMSERDRVTHWYFIEPDPTRAVFLRVHRPELHGDRVERATLRQAVETRDLGAGKELGQTAFALRVVRPWVHGGELLGYVELGEEIDHFLTAMKARTGDEYGLLVKKKFLDEQAWARVLGPRSNTWNDRPDVVVVDTTTFTDGIVDWAGDVELVPEHGDELGELHRGGRVYVRGIFPVRDAAARKVGGLFVLHDFTESHGMLRAARLQTLLALLAVGACAGALLVALARWLVFARLRRLRRALEALAMTQALPPSRVIERESDDEVGRLEALFRRAVFPSRRREPDGAAATGAADGAATGADGARERSR